MADRRVELGLTPDWWLSQFDSWCHDWHSPDVKLVLVAQQFCNKHCWVHVGNRQCAILIYADDTVFVAETVEEMQALLTTIENCSYEWTPRANLSKSQVVYFLLSWGEYVDNFKKYCQVSIRCIYIMPKLGVDNLGGSRYHLEHKFVPI